MNIYSRGCGISMECLGLRNWLKYAEPFTFNIVVNDMQSVMQHEDKPLPKPFYWGVQSSAASWSYKLSVTGKSKRL